MKPELYPSNYTSLSLDAARSLPFPAFIEEMIGYLPEYKWTYLAGGSLITAFNQYHSYEDIDIFCCDTEELAKLTNLLTGHFKLKESHGRGSLRYEANFTTTYYQNDNWRINVIHDRNQYTLKQILNTFDFSICRIGISGTEMLFAAGAPREIQDRKFDLKTSRHELYNLISRAEKYMLKGYRITNYRDILTQIIGNLLNDAKQQTVPYVLPRSQPIPFLSPHTSPYTITTVPHTVTTTGTNVPYLPGTVTWSSTSTLPDVTWVDPEKK